MSCDADTAAVRKIIGRDGTTSWYGRDGTTTWYEHGGYTQRNIGHQLDIVDVVDEYETLNSKEQTT